MGKYLEQYLATIDKQDELRRAAKKQKRELDELGLDTFSADLTAANEGFNKYLTGGWQDSAAANTQRQSINALLSRIQNTKAYMEKYADSYDKSTYDSYMADLDAVEKTLGQRLGYIDQAASFYSKYDSADAYNTAFENAERISALSEKYKGKTSAELLDEAEYIRSIYNNLTGVGKSGFGKMPSNDPSQSIVYEGERTPEQEAAFAPMQALLDRGISLDNAMEYANDLEYLAYTDKEFLGLDAELVSRALQDLTPAERKTKLNAILEAKNLEKWAEQNGALEGKSDKSGSGDGWIDALDAGAEHVEGVANILGSEKISNLLEEAGVPEEFVKNAPIVSAIAGGNLGAAAISALDEYADVDEITTRLSLENYMSEREKATYEYVKGNKGEGAAEAYYKAIEPILNARKENIYNETFSGFASAHPYISSVANVLINNPAENIGALDNIGDYLTTGKINDFSTLNMFANAKDIIRDEVPQVLAQKYGWDENVTSFVYGTGMSIGENALVNLISLAPGGKAVSLAAMGLAAGNTTARQAKAKGATDDEAFHLGMISGVAEVLLESIPLGKWLDSLGGNGKSAIKNWIAQIFSEAGEEVLTEIVNIAADTFILAERSDWQRAMKAYMEEGMSESEAFCATLVDNIDQVLQAGVGGAISGGVMGGLSAIIRGGSDSSVGAGLIRLGGTQAIVDAGLRMGEGTDAFEIASQLQKKSNTRIKQAQKKASAKGANSQTVGNLAQAATGNAAQNTDGADSTDYSNGIYKELYDSEAVGRLYRLLTKQVGTQFIQKWSKTYSDELQKQGVKKTKAEKLGEIVAKATAGEKLTLGEKMIFARSAEARLLLAKSQTVLDLSTQWNVLQNQTKYNVDGGLLLIQRVGDSRYDVSFFENVHEQVAEDAERPQDAAEGSNKADLAEDMESMPKTDPEASESIPPLRELRNRTIPQVEAIIDAMREGATFGEASANNKGIKAYDAQALSTKDTRELVYESAKEAGVSEHNAAMLASLSEAFGGDLRIYFDETGGSRRGVWRREYDGTRSIVINPKSVPDVNEIITHEVFHDLEKTPAGREFIKHAIEYAKSQPAKSGHKFANAANRYEQIKKLYESDGRTAKEDIPGEVGAKVAAELIGRESTLEAVLDRMSAKEASEFTKKLKRAAKAIKNRLAKVDKSKVKGAKLAEHRADMMLELYTRAAKQRALQNTLDNAVGGKKVEAATEKASYAGEKAKTADRTKLAAAKEMLKIGADSEDIRKQTGWFKGYDGKWRFEIDDSKMKVTVPTNKYAKVGDVVDHPTLFEAYPELKEIFITVHDIKGGRGSYSRVFGDIEISADLLDSPDGFRSVIIHELQHAIQDKEGFARGASVEYWEKKLVEGYDSRQAYVKAEEKALLERIKQMRHEDKQNDTEFVFDMEELERQKPNHPRGAINWDTLEQIEEDSPQWKAFDKERDRLSTIYGEEKVFNFLGMASRLEQLKHRGERFAADLYFDTAGEIESRDVQKRLHLDETQRKNTRPDIDQEDVVFAGGAVSYFAKKQYDPEKSGIHDQIRNYQEELNGMETVFSVKAPYKVGEAYDAGTWAISELKKYGYQADRQGFGKIFFDPKGIRDAMNYLDTDEEKVSIIAIYKVLKQGIKIAEHGNHKDRGKHTITFAAPVEINGTRGNMAVVVNMRNNKYKVHRILMPDGSIFKFDETKKDTERETQRGVPKRSLADATSSVPINSISQNSDLSIENEKSDLIEEEIPTNERGGASEYITDEVRQKRMKDLLKRRADDVINKISAEKGSPKLVRGSAQAYNFKVFSETESKNLVNSMIFELNSEKYGTQFEGYNGFGLSTRENKALYDQLFKTFNLAKSRADVERAAYGYADFVISHAAAESVETTEALKQRREKLSAFAAGKGKLNINEETKAELYRIYDEKTASRIVNRWSGESENGVNVDAFVDFLSENGLKISTSENASDAEMLFEIEKEYKKTARAIKKEILSLSEFGDEADTVRNQLASMIIKAYDDGGKDTLKSRIAYAKYEGEIILAVQKAKHLAQRKRDTGVMLSDEFSEVVKSIKRIAIRESGELGIDYGKMHAYVKNVVGFLEKHAGLLMNYVKDPTQSNFEAYNNAKNNSAESDPDQAQLLNFFDSATVAALYRISQRNEADISRDGFSAEDFEAVRQSLNALVSMDLRYDRIFRKGRWIDAKEEVKTGIDQSKRVFNTEAGDAIALMLRKMLIDVTEMHDVAAAIEGCDPDGKLAEYIYDVMVGEQEAAYVENFVYNKKLNEFRENNKAYMNKYSKRKVKFKLDRVNPITVPNSVISGEYEITVDEFFALYSSAQRAHLFANIALGQIKFSESSEAGGELHRHVVDMKSIGALPSSMTDEEYFSTAAKLAKNVEEQLKKVFENDLTDKDRELYGIIDEFFNVTHPSEKSKADMMLRGYTNVGEGHYFPARVDGDALDVNLIGADKYVGGMIGILNLPFNQPTVDRANKPLIIEGALEVMLRHSHQLALYTQLSMPLQNLQKLLTCKIDSTGGQKISMRAYINEKIWKDFSGNKGSGFTKVITKYMRDVQGLNPIEGSRILRWMKGNFTVGVLAGNVKSVLKQEASLFAMIDQVSISSWAKGMLSYQQTLDGEDLPKERYAEMDRFSHGAAIRNSANEQIKAQGVMQKVDMYKQNLMILQAKVDRQVCFTMFQMCQYEVQKKQGYAVGTLENKIAAGEFLDKCIFAVQDTSLVSTKSGIARSSSEVVSSFALFASAPIKTFSRISLRTGTLFAKKAMQKNGIDQRGTWGKAIKPLGASVAAIMITNLFETMLELAWLALRDKWPKDEEGEPKDFFSVALEHYGFSFIDLIPIIGSIADSLVNGYDVSMVALDNVNDVIDAFSKALELCRGLATGDVPEDWHNTLENIVSALAQGFGGLPVNNIETIVNILMNAVGWFDPSIKYGYQDFWYGKSYSKYSSDLKEAVESGDMELASTIIDMMMHDRVDSSAGGEAAAEIADLYASGEEGLFPSKIGSKITVKINDESIELELTAEEQAAFRKEYGKSSTAVKNLINSKAYSRLTSEERATAIRDMYSLYMNRTKTKLHGADMTTAVAITTLISEQKFISAYAHIKEIKADKSIKNNKVQIEKYLRTLGLSRAEQMIILYAAGYRGAENKNAVSRAIRGAKLSAKEKKAVKAALGIE